MVLEKERKPLLVVVMVLCFISITALLMVSSDAVFKTLTGTRDVIEDQNQTLTTQNTQLSDGGGGFYRFAQSFKPTMKTLTNVSINIYKESGSDKDIKVAIFSNDTSVNGTNPPNSTQNITEWVTLLAASAKSNSPGRWEIFTFPTPVELELGRIYWILITLSPDNGTGSTVYQLGESGDQGGSAYSLGEKRRASVFGTFLDLSVDAQRDLSFRTYVYEPLISIESPGNMTTINYTWFNISLIVDADWCGFSYDDGPNVTMSSDSSTHFYYNKTEMTDTQHTVLFWCNFSNNIGNQSSEATRYFTVDETIPEYENSTSGITSPVVYGKTKNHGFQIYVRDNFMNFGEVILSLYSDSWTNYTATNKSANTSSSWVAYQVNVTGLDVGNYTYKWYAWDGLHWNTTDNYTEYNVTKAYPSTNLYLNGTGSQDYERGSDINITSIASDNVLSTTIYGNLSGAWDEISPVTATQNTYIYNTGALPVGWYVVGGNTTGNTNYFDNSTFYNITFYLNDTTGPGISFSPELEQSFGETSVWINVTVNENASSCNVSYGGGSNQSMENTSETQWFYNQSTPSEGNHSIVVYCNDTLDNLGFNSSWFLSDFTAPNTTNIYSMPSSPTSYVLGQEIEFNVTVQDMGIISSVILSISNTNHSMNFIEENNTDLSPPGKIYGVNVTGLGVENYSYYFYVNDSLGNNGTSGSYFFNISKGIPYTNLSLNGSHADYSLDFGQTANITAYPNDPALNTVIYSNFSGTLQPLTGSVQGENSYLENTGALAIGTYQISANVTGNANYTDNSSLITYYLEVQDNEEPLYSAVSVSPSSILEYNTTYYFISNWTDNYGIDVVNFSENSSGSFLNHSVTNISGDSFTYKLNTTDLQGVTTLAWRFYCFDNSTNGNMNQTDLQQLEIKAKTTGLLTRLPTSTTINNMTYDGQNFTLKANLTNNGQNTMYFANLSLSLKVNWYSNASYALCDNITSGSSCEKTFIVFVPGHTGLLGSPTLAVHGNWTDPDNTVNSTTEYVTVSISANKQLEAPEETVEFASANHGSNTTMETFNLSASGNSIINNVVVNTTDGNLTNNWIIFINSGAEEHQSNITYSTISPGSTEIVYTKLNIPSGQDPGFYWTNVTIYSDGGILRDSLYINATVPEDKTWSINATSTPEQILDYASSGVLAQINLSNSGNMQWNWTYDFSGSAIPWLSFIPAESIIVNKTDSRLINISYNLAGLGSGYYTNTFTLTNTSLAPYTTSRTVNITFTVQNLPPSFSNVQTNQLNIESGQSVNISASISDPSTVSKGWVTITLPNGSVENYSLVKEPNPSITWKKNFTAYSSGTYSYQIYGNDTDNSVNSTSVKYFYANQNTSLSVSRTPTSVSLDNITVLAPNTSIVNVTVTNDGNVTAYTLNLTLTVSGNISVNSSVSDFANLTSGSQNSSVHLITTAAGTPPGTYTIPLTTTWTNPDGTIDTETVNFQIIVQNKIMINLTHNLNLTLAQMASELHNLTVYSLGNLRERNINISCYNCSDITTTFSPSDFTVQPNLTKEVEMNITIPAGKPPGEYTLIIYANGSSDSFQTAVPLTVEQNSSWSMTPSFVSLVSGKDNTGIIGYVTVSNYGNVPLNLSTEISGDISYIGINRSYMYLTPLSSDLVKINYSSSAVGNYTINLTISNSSGTPASANTTVNLSVLDLNISITDIQPSSNISAGDTVKMLANAYLEGSPLSSGLSWSATINNTTCVVTSQSNIINALWFVNCTAPNILDGQNYTVVLTANYTSEEATVFDTYNITYADLSAPTLSNYVYPEVQGNQTLNVTLNIIDNVVVDNASALLSFPNNTNQSVTLFQGGTTFILNHTGTETLGEYKLVITANDTSNNTNSSIQAFFSVYTPITFSGTLNNSADQGVQANFSFVRPRSGTQAVLISSDSNGIYNNTVNSVGNMSLIATVYNSTLNFSNAQLIENKLNPFYFDDIPTTELGGRVLKILYANTSLNYSAVTLKFDYTGTGFSNEDYIGMYKCSSWNFTGRSCSSSWTRLSTTKNKIANTIQATSTSLSAYTLAEYICGDDSCETSYGESCSVCTADCGTCSTGGTTGGTTGGGSGGGGGGSGGTTIIEATDKVLEQTLSTSSVRLKKGETEAVFLNILNKLGEPVEVSLSILNLTEFLTLSKNKVLVDNGTEESLTIEAKIPENAVPGSYRGNIILSYKNSTKKLPFSVTILSKGKKIGLSVLALSKEVSSSDIFRYRIVISNDGEEVDYPVELLYSIRETVTGRLLFEDNETVKMGTERITINKEISMKDLDIQLSELSVEVKGLYDGESEEAIDSFSVVPWILKKLLSLEFLRVGAGLAILILGSIPVYYSYTLRKKVIEKRRRYRIELNFDKIPSKGPSTAFIGKIAETEKKTGLDLDNLTTHIMVAGATGSGKTVASQVIAEEALIKNKNVIVFDPSGQWTGFLRKSGEPEMMGQYKKFGLKTDDAKAFNGSIKIVEDPLEYIDMKSLVSSSEPRITVFVLNQLKPEEIDIFVANTVMSVFESRLPESRDLKTLMVYDEVHRLLPKFGGSGKGFIQVERGVREFRKWGIGLVLVSQVLSDFVGEIRANIGIEVQMRTRYEDDLSRLGRKYGDNVSRSIVKAKVGTGLLEYSEYNDGKPYFVDFRPLLHQATRLSDKELEEYSKHRDKIESCKFQMEELKKMKIDVFDIEVELKLADQKLAQGYFDMSSMYLEGIENRLKTEWRRLGKQPPTREKQKIVDKETLNKSLKEAETARKEYIENEDEEKEDSITDKIDDMYTDLKSMVNDCKKYGAETFVEEIEIDRIPTTLKLLRMKQDQKSAEEFLKKLETLKLKLNEKLEKSKELSESGL